MARHRYQLGSVRLIERKNGVQVWVGRWLEDRRGPDGGIHRVHCAAVLGVKKEIPTEKMARRALEPTLARINSRGYRPGAVITFGQFAERWMGDNIPLMKLSTQVGMKAQIGKWLMPLFGSRRIDQIGSEVMQGFVSDMLSRGASPATIRNVFNTFKLIWKAAKVAEYQVVPGCLDIRLPKRERVEGRCFAIEEELRIVQAAAEPYRTMFWVAAATGMRAGELMGLECQDVSAEAITIRQSSWRGRIVSTKTKAGARVCPIGPRLAGHLMEFCAGRSGLLFARDGRRFWPDYVVKSVLHPLCEKLGIAPGGFHAFRHGQATMLDRMSAPLKVRQRRMGHTDAHLTLDVYTHSVGADERRIGNEIDEILCVDLARGSAAEEQPMKQSIVA